MGENRGRMTENGRRMEREQEKNGVSGGRNRKNGWRTGKEMPRELIHLYSFKCRQILFENLYPINQGKDTNTDPHTLGFDLRADILCEQGEAGH